MSAVQVPTLPSLLPSSLVLSSLDHHARSRIAPSFSSTYSENGTYTERCRLARTHRRHTSTAGHATCAQTQETHRSQHHKPQMSRTSTLRWGLYVVERSNTYSLTHHVQLCTSVFFASIRGGHPSILAGTSAPCCCATSNAHLSNNAAAGVAAGRPKRTPKSTSAASSSA